MMTRLFLIRHGESQQNVGDVLSGSTDVPLSIKGKEQCLTLSKFFKKISVDKVFTSPLERAKHSAEIIFPKHTLSIEIIEAITEFNYGDYEGYPRAQYDFSKDIVIQQWISAPSNLTFPGGDNIQEHARKSFDGITKLAKQKEGLTIACISHRTTIRLLIATIIGLSLDNFRSLPCSNCGISELTFEGKWHLQSLNVRPEYLDL